MRALVYDRHGGSAELVLRELPDPVPQAGEVLVRVVAAGVNPVDWKILRGDFPMVAGRILPRGIGCEFAGQVAAIGAGVKEFSPGDLVYGGLNPMRNPVGAVAELVVVQPGQIAPRPDNVTFVGAAVSPVAGGSAIQCLRDLAHVKAGQKIAIIGASGGVGSYTVQTAKAWGVHVTGVCSARNVAFVRALGADEVVAYDQEDFFARPEKFDAIIDAAAAHDFRRCKPLLTPRGVYVNTMPSPRLMWEGLWTRIVGGRQSRPLMLKPSRALLDELAHLLSTRKVRPPVAQVFPFNRASDAYALSATGRVCGKLAIGIGALNQAAPP